MFWCSALFFIPLQPMFVRADRKAGLIAGNIVGKKDDMLVAMILRSF